MCVSCLLPNTLKLQHCVSRYPRKPNAHRSVAMLMTQHPLSAQAGLSIEGCNAMSHYILGVSTSFSITKVSIVKRRIA